MLFMGFEMILSLLECQFLWYVFPLSPEAIFPTRNTCDFFFCFLNNQLFLLLIKHKITAKVLMQYNTRCIKSDQSLPHTKFFLSIT